MSSGVQLLLRLPPAIRHTLLAQEASTRNIYERQIFCFLRLHQTRNFAIGPRLFKGKQQVFKNAQPQKPAPRGTIPQKPAPQVQNAPKTPPSPASLNTSSQTSKKTTPASSPAGSSRPGPGPNSFLRPPPPPPRPTSRLLNSDWLSTRFPHDEKILLYVAPHHEGYFVSSFVLGVIFLIGAFTQAQTFLRDEEGRPKTAWWVKAILSAPVLFITILGTVFLLAPFKNIKSITVIKTTADSTIAHAPFLRIEVKRPLPFAKPDVMEVSPDAVLVEKNVPAFVKDLTFTNHSIKDVGSFTEAYFSGELTKKQGGIISRFNRSLLNIWPLMKKNTRRMAMRDQMVYVQLDRNGRHKLDLQDCHMLEGGSVLRHITKEDVESRPSISSYLRTLMKS